MSSHVGRQLLRLPGSARQPALAGSSEMSTLFCHNMSLSVTSITASLSSNIAGSNLSALRLSVSCFSSCLIRCVQSKLIMTFELQDKEHEMKQQIELCVRYDDAGLMAPFMNRNTFITAQFSTLVAAAQAWTKLHSSNKTHLMLLVVLNSICCQSVRVSYQWHKNDGCSVLIPLKTASYSCLCSSFSEPKAAALEKSC